MVKEAVVEMVLGALARGERVLAVARAYGLDPKTVRAWRRRGRYGARRVTAERLGLLTPFVAWLTARAPRGGVPSPFALDTLVTIAGEKPSVRKPRGAGRMAASSRTRPKQLSAERAP